MIKKLLSSAAILSVVCFNLQAQNVPNPGFETWVSQLGSAEEPEGYATVNIFSNALIDPTNPKGATKATGADAHSGTSVRIETVKIKTKPSGASQIPDTIPSIFTGKIDLQKGVIYGFSSTLRPDKLNFFAKATPMSGDEPYAYMAITRWNGTQRELVGSAWTAIAAGTTYKEYSVPVDYKGNTNTPDTITIYFSASKANKAMLGSLLYVDNVALSPTGINDIVKKVDVKVYPSPAREAVHFAVSGKEATGVEVFNAIGKKTGVYTFSDEKAKVNTINYAPGLYLYNILDKNNKVLNAGKFYITN